MSWRGIHPKGGFLSVWKVLLLTFLLAPLSGATRDGAVQVVPTGGYNDDTRGVILVFARSHELTSVLSTMLQLQRAHDNRFSKDWIFYSDEDISDEFKSLTSNLTLPGTAYYEKWAGRDEFSSIGYSNWPVLARNGRLRGYNWAWKITPGSEFPTKIDFDVFEAMKSQGMVYGSGSSSGPGSSSLKAAVPHNSANIDHSDTNAQAFIRGVCEIRWSVSEDSHGEPTAKRAGGPAKDIMLEGRLRDGSTSQFNKNNITEDSPYWISLIYEFCTFGSSSEISWLDLFRDLDYSSIAKHIIGQGQKRSFIRHTRSNSLATRCSRDNDQPQSMSISPIQPPRHDASSADDTLSPPKPRSGVFYILGNPEDDISMVHRRWARIALDFEKQRKIPGLRAGRTTLFASSEMWDPYHHMGWAKSSELPLFMGYV